MNSPNWDALMIYIQHSMHPSLLNLCHYLANIAIVFQSELSLWTKLFIWSLWTILFALEPYCPLNLSIYWFSKSRHSKKNLKRQYGLIHIVLSQNFNPSSKDNIARSILSSQGFFTNFHLKLAFYFCFKHLL